jgi:hypothetical protein
VGRRARPLSDWTPAERRALAALRTPYAVQAFLDALPYNTEHEGESFRSPRRVLRDRTANCIEGAVFAAAALRAHRRPPLIMDLTAVHDEDHVIAPFRERGGWGAIGTSKFSGLRYREPVYRSLRELVMSYFEHYFNLAGERTLRGYGRPVNLARFDHMGWMTAEEDLWAVAEHLESITHVAILPGARAPRLTRVDERLMRAGVLDHPGVSPAAPAGGHSPRRRVRKT